jgi:hypothetical protein
MEAASRDTSKIGTSTVIRVLTDNTQFADSPTRGRLFILLNGGMDMEVYKEPSRLFFAGAIDLVDGQRLSV